MNNIDISLAGEYYVASIMHLHGWNAAMTLKNYPDIDILGYNPVNMKRAEIQVKTGKNKYTVLTGIKFGNFTRTVNKINHPYVFVHIYDITTIDCFILKATDFITLATKEHSLMTARNNRNDSLIKFKWKDLAAFKDQWQNLW